MEWLANIDGIDWKALAVTVGIKVLGALLILFIGLRIVKWIAGVAERGLTRAKVEPTAVQFLRKVAFVVLVVVLLLAVLQVVGVPMTSMIAVLGAAETGRAHVLTPVTNAHLVCRLLLDIKLLFIIV